MLKLSLLIIGCRAVADDFSASVRTLQEQQGELAKMIMPYKSLPGLKGGSALGSTDEKPKSILTLHNSATRLQAPIGKLLFGKTVNRLVVGTESSPVLVELKDQQGGFSGLRIMGTATQSSTPGRLNIQAQRVVFRSGSSQLVQGMILDQEGAQGIGAQVLSQKALTIAGALGSSFISGLAAAEQSTSTNAFGFETTQRSARNSLLGGLAQTAADQSKRFIEEATSEKPVLILDAGTQVTVLLQEEVRF